jgi:tRNA modification GTPase
MDTAGIHNPKNSVEKAGISRSFFAVNKADLVIFLTAANQKESTFEKRILEELAQQQKKVIAVITKTDLTPASKKLKTIKARKIPCISTSLVTQAGRNAAIKFVYKNIQKEAKHNFEPSIFLNMRHEQIARDIVLELGAALKAGTGLEIVAHHLKQALVLIGHFSGATTPDEILDSVFNKFCIGK